LKKETFQYGIELARKIILDIIEKYKDKESDNLQEDIKKEVNQALDKILQEE